MPDTRELLAAYDHQLRTDAETPGAVAVQRHGPLRLVTFAGGRGFVTYRDLDGADAERIATLVAAAVEHFRGDPDITHVEWKARGHDRAPGLHDALVGAGFEPGELESIMIGDASLLCTDVRLPAGVTVRRVSEADDVRAMCAMQDTVFGDPVSDFRAQPILDRLARDDGMQLWVAQAGADIVSAGRLEPVAGTSFAGIWGGCTVPSWRGHGIYRALTAARAQAALILGKTLVNSDSTEYSRPILERAGLSRVSTTTPYTWIR